MPNSKTKLKVVKLDDFTKWKKEKRDANKSN